MPVSTATEIEQYPRYVGLRLSADEYFELADDGFRYELINGVMVMSPSPMLAHQAVVVEFIAQIAIYLREHPVGKVFPDIDVRLDKDLVYRPDVVFVRSERLRKASKRLNVIPDLVVEIISPSSRLLDRREKKLDYERHGVQEYWVVDPEGETFTFYCREGELFLEVESKADQFVSRAVPGFKLDLSALRAVLRSL